MSDMELHQVLCDHGEDCEADAGAWLTERGARANARERGWWAPGDEAGLTGTRDSVFREPATDDYCPQHRALHGHGVCRICGRDQADLIHEGPADYEGLHLFESEAAR